MTHSSAKNNTDARRTPSLGSQTHALDRTVYMIGSYLILNTNRLLSLLRVTFVFHTYHFAESQDRMRNTTRVPYSCLAQFHVACPA